VRALLSEAVGGPQVLTAPGELITYARDATASLGVTPSAVVLPASTDEVQSVLRIAHQHRLPVVPRGAGTSLAGGTVALRHAIVLSMAWMRATLEVSPREMLVRAEAGTTTQSVIQAAADVGLLYPPDPGSRSVCTIGGNVATCAGGLRGLKYGVTRNYILGLTAVLADGSRITTGGRLWKDVAGYDLTRLLTGSEGTLAVITEVTVALRPAPRFEAVGLAFFDSLADAAATVDAIVGSGILPSRISGGSDSTGQRELSCSLVTTESRTQSEQAWRQWRSTRRRAGARDCGSPRIPLGSRSSSTRAAAPYRRCLDSEP